MGCGAREGEAAGCGHEVAVASSASAARIGSLKFTFVLSAASLLAWETAVSVRELGR
jgi:hypothetical protein